MRSNIEAATSTSVQAGRKTARMAVGAALFAAMLVAAPTLAQRHAVPRSGGGGGGGGGGSFSGHSGGGPSGGGGGAHRPSGGGPGGSPGHGGGGWSGGGYHGGYDTHRPTGGYHHGGGGHNHYYYPYYYPYYSFTFGYGWPYYYSPYYYGYYPYSPYYYGYYRPYGYYGGYYPPYYGYSSAPSGGGSYEGGASYDDGYAAGGGVGAIALRVRPKSAEVYLDGRYVGVAGSYDGYPGYLWVPTGTHRLELVQDGYTNLDQKIEVASGQVTELKLQMQEGVADRPATHDYSQPAPSRAPYPDRGGYEGGAPPDRGAPLDRGGRPDLGGEPRDDRGTASRGAERTDLGRVMLEVRPDDASVYLDGRFVGTGRDVTTATEPLLVVPGEHRLQVVHPDYANEDRSFSVSAGEEKMVGVELHRGAGV